MSVLAKIVDLKAYRNARVQAVAEIWPEDWIVAVEPPQRSVRFSLDWLPAWFELVAIVAEERKRAAEAESGHQ